MGSPRMLDGLASCHGFRVAAGGYEIGAIETPVFGDTTTIPDHLLVRTVAAVPGTFRVVPASVVQDVDPVGRVVTLHIDAARIASFPEQLPLQRG